MRKFLYISSKAASRRGYIAGRRFILDATRWSKSQIEEYQDREVSRILEFSRRNIPFYRDVMNTAGLGPAEICGTASLNTLPVIDKAIIKANLGNLLNSDKKRRFVESSSGGSTGIPIKYRMSIKNALYSSLILDRGLGLGGYAPGDRLAVIAGGSLVGKRKTINLKLIEQLTNIRYFSSYGMDENVLNRYITDLTSFQPKFLRGYASALGAFAAHVEKHNLSARFNIQAVFSTSEMLLDNIRRNIESVFKCRVFDGWGLNDGGASAFECPQHHGMHIDPERAYVEIVEDAETKQFGAGVGKVVVTNLIDEVMPFIRYDSGDIGHIDHSACKCGMNSPRLFLKYGRIADQLIVGGSILGAPVLTVLMGKLPIRQYQVAKISESSLVFRIIKDENYSKRDEDFILRSMSERISGGKVLFEYLDQIIPPKGIKHKFLIDETIRKP